jgi:thymidylate synthase (FAD)
VAEYTLPEVQLDWITPSAEQVMARHARVSTSNPDRDDFEKLLAYCIKHSHWSVFEQACASFEITTTRAISQQIIRHKSFNFQELSQRYSDPTDVLKQHTEFAANFELRAQDHKNRQNSIEYANSDIEERFRPRINQLFSDIQELYADMLSASVAKECARNILPVAMPTRLHMTGSIRSWVFYVGLRSAPGTQKEHKLVSDSIGRSLVELLPVTISAVLSQAKSGSNQGLTGWNFIQ